MSASSVKNSGVKNSRRFRVFAITFAAVYAAVYYVALSNNWPLFSYGPAVGEWTLFNHAASDGPTMYWYGWIATSTIAAAAVGLIASFLAESLGRKLWSGLAWLIPVCAIAAIFHLLGGYFTH